MTHAKDESAYSWDPNRKLLVEKPASSRSGSWASSTGSYLFLWADEVINEDTIASTLTSVSLMKHETFPNGREGQHTWT